MSRGPETGTQATPEMVARTAPIIAIALVMGVSTFLAIVVVLRSSKGLFAPEPWDVMPPKGMLTLMGLGFGGVMIVVSFLVPRIIVGKMRKMMAKEMAGKGIQAIEGDLGLYGAFQAQLIIGLATLEGAAFFNVIAFLLEGRAPSPIMVAVLLGFILARFPTRGAIDAWVEDQRARTLEERNFA